MKKVVAWFMSFVLLIMPTSAMAETGSVASWEAIEEILEIEPENMSYDQYFMFEHGFHSDEASAEATLLSRKTKDGDFLFTQSAGSVYADGNRVTGYVGNSEMVFYMVGNSIYRYHVKSQRTDLIYQGNGIVTWYPITSKVLLIGKRNNGLSTMSVAASQPACTDSLDKNNLTYYSVDTEKHTSAISVNPERLIALTTNSGYYNVPNFHTTINGKAIPHAKYPNGSYYDDNDYQGAIQCAGFAIYIYTYIWGSEGGDLTTYNATSQSGMKNILSSVRNGARLRVVDRTTNIAHSFVLCASSSSAVTVYHANWTLNNDNLVQITRFTYEQFYSAFSEIINARVPY